MRFFLKCRISSVSAILFDQILHDNIVMIPSYSIITARPHKESKSISLKLLETYVGPWPEIVMVRTILKVSLLQVLATCISHIRDSRRVARFYSRK